MTWTAERTAQLRELWAANHPASYIAHQLGVSRNAVIGKAHRLCLRLRKKAPPGRASSARPPSDKVIQRQPKPAKQSEPDVIHFNDNAIPLAQRRTLATLTDYQCHFPVGDPGTAEFFYCGAPIANDCPYCLDHQKRMFRPVPPRQRQTPRPTKVSRFA